MNIAHRRVPLGTGRLEFDYNQGAYRVAYYEPLPGHLEGDPRGEKRTAVRHAQLGQALLIVLGEADAPHDPETVELYLRSQPWGKELP